MNIGITLIGQMISFAVFVWFTMKFVWPPLMRAMERRQQNIADGLAAAERSKHDLELAQKKAGELMREAREQAADVIVEAGKRAAGIMDESKSNARAEGERLLLAARAEIELEANRAREHLRTAVAELAVAGAARILEKEIDRETHAKLLDSVVAKL
ncbi:MAG: F0F1 ATP synthase subunit B [Pseudomonadota bacterium]